MVPCPVEGLEARLATLREGIVDIPTTESAVERAQVSSLIVLILVILISSYISEFMVHVVV